MYSNADGTCIDNFKHIKRQENISFNENKTFLTSHDIGVRIRKRFVPLYRFRGGGTTFRRIWDVALKENYNTRILISGT